jgi:hypothetical protein
MWLLGRRSDRRDGNSGRSGSGRPGMAALPELSAAKALMSCGQLLPRQLVILGFSEGALPLDEGAGLTRAALSGGRAIGRLPQVVGDGWVLRLACAAQPAQHLLVLDVVQRPALSLAPHACIHPQELDDHLAEAGARVHAPSPLEPRHDCGDAIGVARTERVDQLDLRGLGPVLRISGLERAMLLRGRQSQLGQRPLDAVEALFCVRSLALKPVATSKRSRQGTGARLSRSG